MPAERLTHLQESSTASSEPAPAQTGGTAPTGSLASTQTGATAPTGSLASTTPGSSV